MPRARLRPSPRCAACWARFCSWGRRGQERYPWCSPAARRGGLPWQRCSWPQAPAVFGRATIPPGHLQRRRLSRPCSTSTAHHPVHHPRPAPSSGVGGQPHREVKDGQITNSRGRHDYYLYKSGQLRWLRGPLTARWWTRPRRCGHPRKGSGAVPESTAPVAAAPQ